MLLDRTTAPQRPAAKACPRFIEGRVQAPGTARVLEQPELRSGRAEVVQMWGRPESAREEFRRMRAL